MRGVTGVRHEETKGRPSARFQGCFIAIGHQPNTIEGQLRCGRLHHRKSGLAGWRR